MPKFRISISPAARTASGTTQIVITNTLKRATVECTLDKLRSAMEEAAKDVKSTVPDSPLLHVYASPDGRSPNGFKAFQARAQNEMVIDPAAATAEPETADAA